MPLKKLTTLERKQIDVEMNELKEKKKLLKNLLNQRELLLETLVEELKVLKEKYNVKRKTKIIHGVNRDIEIDTINKQILEELIDKKAKLLIDNRLYLKNSKICM